MNPYLSVTTTHQLGSHSFGVITTSDILENQCIILIAYVLYLNDMRQILKKRMISLSLSLQLSQETDLG